MTPLPRRILNMYTMYGVVSGKVCGDCPSFLRHKHRTKTHNKCTRNKMTHGAATDWRVNWPACGKIEEPTGT